MPLAFRGREWTRQPVPTRPRLGGLTFSSLYPFIVFCLVIAALPGQRLDQGEKGQTRRHSRGVGGSKERDEKALAPTSGS